MRHGDFAAQHHVLLLWDGVGDGGTGDEQRVLNIVDPQVVPVSFRRLDIDRELCREPYRLEDCASGIQAAGNTISTEGKRTRH